MKKKSSFKTPALIVLFALIAPLPFAAGCGGGQNPAVNPLTAPRQPGPPAGGPYTHRVMSATSGNGLDWTYDDRTLIEHASVPSAIVTPAGNLRVYYVDAGQVPETTNCAESTDGGKTFRVLGLSIENRPGEKALDPSIVLLPDGRYRLYYFGVTGSPSQAGEHSIYSAISDDGVRFVQEREAFKYPGLVDPDVFWTGSDWMMYVFSLDAGGTITARSADGRSFEYAGPLSLKGWGTVAPVALGDGRFRLYAFDQPAGTTVASFLSSDCVTWTREEGTRLSAPEGFQITDPFVVRLADGSWKMIFKVQQDMTGRAGPTP